MEIFEGNLVFENRTDADAVALNMNKASQNGNEYEVEHTYDSSWAEGGFSIYVYANNGDLLGRVGVA